MFQGGLERAVKCVWEVWCGYDSDCGVMEWLKLGAVR